MNVTAYLFRVLKNVISCSKRARTRVCVCLGMFVLSSIQSHIMAAACVSGHICPIHWRKGYYAIHVCVCPICNWVCWLGFI